MILDGLTPRQVELASILWSLDTAEECAVFLSSLPNNIRQDAEVVMQLMMMEAVESQIENMTTYPDAENILKKM